MRHIETRERVVKGAIRARGSMSRSEGRGSGQEITSPGIVQEGSKLAKI